jgi:Protein of unknown function (DUF3153)
MSKIDPLLRLLAIFRSGLLLLGLLITGALGGCVRYETAIRFYSFNAGELVQHVQLDPQLYQLDRSAVERWLKSIEQRTTALGGEIQQPSQLDLTARVPFHTARELSDKFAAFFPAGNNAAPMAPQLHLQESNFLFASRYRLEYDVDLRDLTKGLTAQQASAVSLSLALQVPDRPWNPSRNWQLSLGQNHHAAATFWLLNPLGIGGAIIIGLVVAAYWLQARLAASRS